MSSWGAWSWSVVAATITTAFVVGAAPVLVVRLLALFYPKGHPRRRELVAEMEHVKRFRDVVPQWLWLGGMFATSLVDGLTERRKADEGSPEAVPVTGTRLQPVVAGPGTPWEGEFYCVRCKDRRTASGVIEVNDKGTKIARAACPTCGTKLNRILGRATQD